MGQDHDSWRHAPGGAEQDAGRIFLPATDPGITPIPLQQNPGDSDLPNGGPVDQENLVIREQRVLVVDDDPVNVEIFRTILDDQCRMFVAGDGPAALAMAERERPDIVLLDVMMPGMSGL